LGLILNQPLAEFSSLYTKRSSSPDLYIQTIRTELQPTPREPDCSSKFLPLPGIYPNYDLAPDGKRRRATDSRLHRTRRRVSVHTRGFAAPKEFPFAV
jgi:hypothetical protein